MLDGQRYFAHYPDEDPANQRKRPTDAELIKTLAGIEREVRLCLEGRPDQKDVAGATGTRSGAAGL